MTDPFGWALLDARGLFVTFIRSEELAKETLHTLNVGGGIPGIRPFRLTSLFEIPAWQPIETARKYGKPIILGRFGCSTPGRWHGGMFRADNINIADDPPWTHWQPLPEPPEES